MDDRTKQFNTLAEEYFQCFLALKQAAKDSSEAGRKQTECEAKLDKLKHKLGEFVGGNITTKAVNLNGAMLTIDYGNNNTHTIKVYSSDGNLLR